jgi:hypothetical protein
VTEWIKHQGTTMPVPRGTLVDIKCKDGAVLHGIQAGISIQALPYFWTNDGSVCDITEYRVCEGKKK